MWLYCCNESFNTFIIQIQMRLIFDILSSISPNLHYLLDYEDNKDRIVNGKSTKFDKQIMNSIIFQQQLVFGVKSAKSGDRFIVAILSPSDNCNSIPVNFGHESPATCLQLSTLVDQGENGRKGNGFHAKDQCMERFYALLR